MEVDYHGYNEDDAFLCESQGLPYTLEEWEREVDWLRDALSDARQRLHRARTHGVCLPARFDQGRAATEDVETSSIRQVGADSDERLLDELKRTAEFLNRQSCGDAAVAVDRAIRRLGPAAPRADTRARHGSDSKGERS